MKINLEALKAEAKHVARQDAQAKWPLLTAGEILAFIAAIEAAQKIQHFEKESWWPMRRDMIALRAALEPFGEAG